MTFNIEDYGAVATPGHDNSAAIMAAMQAASGQGGGIVIIPAKLYECHDLSFAGMLNVRLQGEVHGKSYGDPLWVSALFVTTGTWGIRFDRSSKYCGIQDIGINSNGVLSVNLPHDKLYGGGVEYGVITETETTTMKRVVINAFRHGCVGANALNGNLFDEICIVNCTDTGFAATNPSAESYALHHPNLTPPSSFTGHANYKIRDSFIRRNRWGVIIRGGSAFIEDCTIESQWCGNGVCYIGTYDSGCSVNLRGGRIENGWADFNASITYTIEQNNFLLDTPGVCMPFIQDSDTTKSDAGFQWMFASKSTGTVQGPGYSKFTDTVMSLGTNGATPQKAILFKQCYGVKLKDCCATGGDQVNSLRFGNGSGDGSLANFVHWEDWNGYMPAYTGNRGFVVSSEHSAATGGLTAAVGAFRNP